MKLGFMNLKSEVLRLDGRSGSHLLRSYLWFKNPRISRERTFGRRDFGYSARYAFFQSLSSYLQLNRITGSYLEFGSHELNTARIAMNTIGRHNLPIKVSRFFLFDTFAGMPAPTGVDEQRIWRAGMNSTGLSVARRTLRRDLYRTTLVPGLYSDTLATFGHPDVLPIAVAYVDCDYYRSAKDVLDFLGSRLSHGSVLVFDDWDAYYADPERGERRAFKEFEAQCAGHLTFTPFMRLASGGMSFVVHEQSKIGTAVP